MPFNGSGTYNAPAGSWNPSVNGAPATQADWDAMLADFEASFSGVMTRDGQSPATANIPLGGNRITGVGPGISLTDAATVSQSGGETTKNMDIAFSVASNALTAALKGADGNDPSATNPVSVTFRSATVSSYAPTIVRATAAITMTVSSGSTLGATSGVPRELFWYGGYTGSAIVLGVSAADFGDEFIASSTAEGGAGAADSATVLYSTSSQSSIAWRKLIRTRDTQTTAGTYTATPSEKYGGASLNRRPGEQKLYDSGALTNQGSFPVASVITSEFANYRIEADLLSVAGAADLHFQISTDNGSTYLSGAGVYAYGRWANGSDLSSGAAGSSGDTKITMFGAAGATYPLKVTAHLRAQQSPSGALVNIQFRVTGTIAGVLYNITGSGYHVSATDCNAFRFLFSSGNISGRVRVYGSA